MKVNKKILAVLIMVLFIGLVMGMSYIRMRYYHSEMTVVTYKQSVSFMAGDRSTIGGYVLSNETNTYRVVLGTFGTNTSKTYPGAFAIVNPQDVGLIIRKITVKNDIPLCLRIYLHSNLTRPCNSSLVAPGTLCETDKQLYYNGSSIDYGASGWKVGSGLGYNDTGDLIYTSDGITGTNATWDNNVWVYDENGSNLAVNGTSNFVWVEISLVVPKDSGLGISQEYEGELIVDIEVEFTPAEGPSIEFMACDKTPYGGFVLTGFTNRSVRFNLGTIHPGANKTYPGAFAVVNTGGVNTSIQKIEVTGDINQYLRIYLHRNHTLPCDSNMVAPGIKTEASENKTLYYDGSSIDYGENGWRLGNGVGYDSDKNLLYTDDGSTAHAVNASRVGGYPDSKYYVWIYNATPSVGSNLADNGTSNFVWVEIDIIVPDDASEMNVSGEIIFYFRSVI